MLVRVQQSTPSWAIRKYLCLPRLVTPSIFRYLFYSIGLCISFSASTPFGCFWSSLPLMCCSSFPSCAQHKLLTVFQTLFVEPGLCLCDCPGLVMPSFVSTKAEMICNGILPIDQMRDHVPPISLISFLLCKDSDCYMYVRASSCFWTLPCIRCIQGWSLRMQSLKYFTIGLPKLIQWDHIRT